MAALRSIASTRRWSRVTLGRETLHIMDGQQRIALVETKHRGRRPLTGPPLMRYQIGNHLGSASLELDEAAQVISYEEYHPYGTTSYRAMDRVSEAAAKRYRYTGMERDEETGLAYHGTRYYVGWLGRWITPDPKGLVDGTNLFRYGRNCPAKYSDPLGTSPDDTLEPKPSTESTASTESEVSEEVESVTTPEVSDEVVVVDRSPKLDRLEAKLQKAFDIDSKIPLYKFEPTSALNPRAARKAEK